MKRKILQSVTRALVPAIRGRIPPSKDVAILVPLSTRAELTEEEMISMRQLQHYLGSYDKFLIAPEGLEFDFEGFQIKRFAKKFFGSAAAHGKLLGYPGFYREFYDYKFIFFYHLDSLVFSNQLKEWCETELDYIGPPWINCSDSPWVETPRVGNGGFTLLRVESALKVFRSRYRQEPVAFWLDVFTRNAPRWSIGLLEKLHQGIPKSKVLKRLLTEWHEIEDPAPNNRNNDIFWSDKAVRYLPEFRVASLEDGLRFAFEVAPRTCLEMNGGKMPFGCHAWSRYDRKFWEPHLVSNISIPDVRVGAHC
ncbi:MAG: DUF5672 family protein [Luteolibacter sp.]